MTCRDIMTENPSSCSPSDSAATAARIMKTEDVGPVPVVEDKGSMRLVGIVTDRDLAVKVVAEGRDPNSVRIEEIMSRDLVTCSPEDDVAEAMQAMANHQVRRIPIVDSERRLVGIIAQADVARHLQEEEVGGVVGDVSEPGGFGSRMFGGGFSGSGSAGQDVGSSLMAAVIGIGLGAGLMYLLDPNTGRRRRAIAKDRAYSWSKSAASEVNRRAKDIGNRAAGVMAETRGVVQNAGEETSDEKLVSRVRSELGHVVPNARQVQVSARDGHVTLMGWAPSSEVDSVISCVAGVQGVKSVDNRLQSNQGQQQPAFQGGENRRM